MATDRSSNVVKDKEQLATTIGFYVLGLPSLVTGEMLQYVSEAISDN